MPSNSAQGQREEGTKGRRRNESAIHIETEQQTSLWKAKGAQPAKAHKTSNCPSDLLDGIYCMNMIHRRAIC